MSDYFFWNPYPCRTHAFIDLGYKGSMICVLCGEYRWPQ